MTDKELLELAAKAIGLEGCIIEVGRRKWNPLTDDGDALRLAVSLEIGIEFGECLDSAPVVRCGASYDRDLWEVSANFPDRNAATRRAIVRAAAAIGQAVAA